MKPTIGNFLKSHPSLFVVSFAFVFGLLLFFIAIPNLTKPAHALGATGLSVTNQTCTSTGQVNLKFNWTIQPQGAFFQTDIQWLDLSTNTSENWSDPTKYPHSSNPPSPTASSYTTGQAGGQIGPLVANTDHVWRINTHNSLQGNAPESWYPTPNEPFKTIDCTITPPPPTGDGGPYTVVVAKPDATAADVGTPEGYAKILDVEQNIAVTSFTFDAGRLLPEWNDKDVMVYVCSPNCSVASNLITAWSPNPKLCKTNLDGLLYVDWGVNNCGATVPPPTSGSTTCNDNSPAPTGDWFFRWTYDKTWTAAICKDVADQVMFNWGQTYAMADSVFSFFWADSLLHPETNEATAGSGAIAASGKLVASLYSPPLSGVSYLASEFNHLNPVQDVYAQGIGYNVLLPVQNVWEAFRNISYVGFVLVFVIVGFMIMFRAHISPQAVATVQDSLPRIVIALILVTFSYAIAGFMIDLMFLFLNVAINALPVSDKANIVFRDSIFGVIWGSTWKEFFGVVKSQVSIIIESVVDISIIDKIFGLAGGLIVGLIMGIALLIIMFKIFFQLLIAYATIIILTVSAPFFFLMQALPGNNSAQTWFKQMAANILIFPVVALMFILAGYLGNIKNLGGQGNVIGSQEVAKFPLLAGNLDTEVLGKLIAIGIIMMTPGVSDMIKSAIGAKTQGGGAMGAAAAGAIGAGAGYGLAGPSAVGRAAGARASTEAGRATWTGAKGIARAGWSKAFGGPGSKTS